MKVPPIGSAADTASVLFSCRSPEGRQQRLANSSSTNFGKNVPATGCHRRRSGWGASFAAALQRPDDTTMDHVGSCGEGGLAQAAPAEVPLMVVDLQPVLPPDVRPQQRGLETSCCVKLKGVWVVGLPAGREAVSAKPRLCDVHRCGVVATSPAFPRPRPLLSPPPPHRCAPLHDHHCVPVV